LVQGENLKKAILRGSRKNSSAPDETFSGPRFEFGNDLLRGADYREKSNRRPSGERRARKVSAASREFCDRGTRKIASFLVSGVS